MTIQQIFGFIVFWFLVLRLSFVFIFRPLFQWLFPPKNIWQIDNGRAFAVITGGTDGIGLAYSKYLASLGYRLLIISRNADKLDTVKSELEKSIKNCPEILTLSFDFGTSNLDDYNIIEKKFSQLSGRIHVLVNNVGVSFKICEFFSIISTNDSSLLRQMILINAVSAVKMTQLVLPEMVQHNRGIIITVGSQSAVSPVPLLTLYSATKAFVDYFTRSIAKETRTRAPDVIIHSVLPGFVATKMSHLRPSWTVPTPERFIRSAMTKVGVESQTFGFWYHSLEGAFYSLTKLLLGENFNCWLAFTVLSGYRRKFYRAKHIEFNTFFD